MMRIADLTPFADWWARNVEEAYDHVKEVYCSGWDAAAKALRSKKIIPWLQMQSPATDVSDYPGTIPGMTALDHAATGLAFWHGITDTAIVTTRADMVEEIFPPLLDRAPPGMSIIGGIQTGTVLPGCNPYVPTKWDFADLTAWQRIGEIVKRIHSLTGQPVLLDNESSLKPYHEGYKQISIPRLTLALQGVAVDGVVPTWWSLPQILPDVSYFPQRRVATADLLRTVARGLLGAIFVAAHTTRKPYWRDDNLKVSLREEMRSIIGQDRIVERINVAPYGIDEGHRYTPMQAVREIYGLALGGEDAYDGLDSPVVIWPGSRDWLPVAEQWAT